MTWTMLLPIVEMIGLALPIERFKKDWLLSWYCNIFSCSLGGPSRIQGTRDTHFGWYSSILISLRILWSMHLKHCNYILYKMFCWSAEPISYQRCLPLERSCGSISLDAFPSSQAGNDPHILRRLSSHNWLIWPWVDLPLPEILIAIWLNNPLLLANEKLRKKILGSFADGTALEGWILPGHLFEQGEFRIIGSVWLWCKVGESFFIIYECAPAKTVGGGGI